MDISKLPTDNLYKFMALFGLALVLVSLVGLIYSKERYFSDFNAAILKIEKDIELWHQLYKDQEKISYKSHNKKMLSDVTRALADLEYSQYKLSNKYITKRLNNFTCLFNLAFWLGFILMFSGFFLWHKKLQLYNDKKLKFDVIEGRYNAKLSRLNYIRAKKELINTNQPEKNTKFY